MAKGQTIRLVGPAQRKLAHDLIDRAPDGAILNVQEARRSLEQNARFHAMLSDVSRAKPDGRVYDVETWKCIFLDAAGFKPRWIPALDGDGVINTGYRSSRLTKAEMSQCIECMYEFGARHEIKWTEPNPYA